MVFSLAICCPGRLIVLRELHDEGLTLAEHVVALLAYLTLELVNELLMADFDMFAILYLLMLVGSRSNFELLVLFLFDRTHPYAVPICHQYYHQYPLRLSSQLAVPLIELV